jgi:hypothetical protein
MQDLLEKIRRSGRFQVLPGQASFIILLRRGIADPSAKPPPFLGVSSLNLAALAFPKRPFFLPTDLSGADAR